MHTDLHNPRNHGLLWELEGAFAFAATRVVESLLAWRSKRKR